MRARIEAATAALLVTIAVVLHVVFFQSAGALWRDELVSVHVALSPSMLGDLHFESFPILWPLLLRGYLALGLPLRLLGMLIGLLSLAAVWIAGKALSGRIPVIALAIAASTASVIRSGDEIRGYGLGIASGVLAMALIGRGRFVLATIAAIVAVQCTYYNAVLVFACCVARLLVGPARECDDLGRMGEGPISGDRPLSTFRRAKPLATGLIAALTLLPYIAVARERRGWDSLESFHIDLATYAKRALEASGYVLPIVVVTALIVAALRVTRTLSPRSGPRAESPHHTMYASITLLLFALGHFLFLRAVGYFPQPWYFAILIVVSAVAADAMLDFDMYPRVAITVVILAIAIRGGARDITLRQTNADFAADLVARGATRDDLVIVYPWTVGVSFNAYYRGVAPWQTLPPLSDHRLQRYDLVKSRLNDPRGAEGLAQAASAKLSAGHHVWLVGFPLYADRAAFADQTHMSDVERADALWCAPLDRALRSVPHRLVLPPVADISRYERLEVVVF
jgi:hypothetical protein